VICPSCRFDAIGDARFCPRCGAPLAHPDNGTPSATRAVFSSDPGDIPGRTVAGRYRLLKFVGRGGMGVVFKAEDTRLQRTVALKLLPDGSGQSPEARERFLREARAAAILDHPNICPVHEVDTADGAMFLTMAFVEGRSLKDRITEGPLPIAALTEIALQIAEGLKAAHEKGVIHRDIKPANIMLSREGQARITDFGLASLEGGTDLTQPHTILGTAPYMSPEQIRGEKAGPPSDVWSFGCTLFEMATGRRPFQADRGDAVLIQILHDEVPRPSAIRADIPAGLEEIILRCLRKDPAGRYPDAGALVQALKKERARAAAVEGATASPRGSPPSLAVLPFADMSPAKDHEYFGEGLAEELIHALARIQGIRVVARTSAFALKGMNLDVRTIAKMLDVGAVLEGSIRKAGNRLRVTAQLIDAGTGYHVWSERFDREERDVFDIQDEISHAIVEHLKVTLLADEKSALRKRSTADPEAYDLYLKGLYFVARLSPESLGKALDFFQQAIARDPTFALAHAGVALVFSALGIMNFAPPTETYPRAKSALAQAFSLDPDLAEAHGIAAVLAFWYEWNWSAAEEGFRRVLCANPGDAMSHGNYAFLLMSRRRFDDSIREIKQALMIDPLMPLFYAWSMALHNAVGRYDEALEEFAKVMQIDPAFALAYFHAAMALAQKGLLDQAIETFEKGRTLVSFRDWDDGWLVICYRRKGEIEKAARLEADMLEKSKTSPASPVSLAWNAAGAGDMDAAFRWLDMAFEKRDILMPFVHIYSELMAPELTRDPRFEGVLRRMNLLDVRH
jgi:TolB-like protein/Tfp pilus assembly protein PilF/predicted Ser/Thr protein kinase